MKRFSFKARLFTAAALMVAAAVLLIFFLNPGRSLVLQNRKTGEVYAAYPISEGERFSVEFIHSVNKTPVRDVYEIRNGNDIYVVETDYFGFGAGVQTQLNPGETLEYGDDGSMQIKNINILLSNLTYVVGTVSDHTLRIGDEEISLLELCGRNSSVTFTIKRRPF